MKVKLEILSDQYVDVEYRQFNQSSTVRRLMRIVGWLCLPLVYPLTGIAKLAPETGFRTISELLSMIPFAIGVIFRYEFYRRTLRSCGENIFISFGTIFYYPEVNIGNNVLIGMFNTIHHCDFGDDIMTAEGCRFLSGSKYHNFSRTDLPMTQQGGKMKRILIGDDVWVGANAIVMEDVGNGSIVGAGAVVTKKVEPHSVVVGNPAKAVKKRV